MTATSNSSNQPVAGRNRFHDCCWAGIGLFWVILLIYSLKQSDLQPQKFSESVKQYGGFFVALLVVQQAVILYKKDAFSNRIIGLVLNTAYLVLLATPILCLWVVYHEQQQPTETRPLVVQTIAEELKDSMDEMELVLDRNNIMAGKSGAVAQAQQYYQQLEIKLLNLNHVSQRFYPAYMTQIDSIAGDPATGINRQFDLFHRFCRDLNRIVANGDRDSIGYVLARYHINYMAQAYKFKNGEFLSMRNLKDYLSDMMQGTRPILSFREIWPPVLSGKILFVNELYFVTG